MSDVSDGAHCEFRNASLNDDMTCARRITVAQWPNRTCVSYIGGDLGLAVNVAAFGLSLNARNIVVDGDELVEGLDDESDASDNDDPMTVDFPLPAEFLASAPNTCVTAILDLEFQSGDFVKENAVAVPAPPELQLH